LEAAAAQPISWLDANQRNSRKLAPITEDYGGIAANLSEKKRAGKFRCPLTCEAHEKTPAR